MRRLPNLSYPIRLDLGCGKFPTPGHIALDCNDYGQDVVWDANQGLPFPNDSVCGVYSSHFFEHIAWAELPNLLEEIVRVCRDGTRLRIIVPHADTKEAFYLCHKTQWNDQVVRGVVADHTNLGLVSTSRHGIHFDFTLVVMKEGRVRERVTIGQYDDDVEREHIARYEFAKQFCAGKTVADIACGTGYGSEILRAVAKEVMGYDKELLCGNCVIDLDEADWEEQYDVVVSFETIEHLSDPVRFLNNIRRTSHVAVISTPLNDVADNPYHKHRWSFAEISALLTVNLGECMFFLQSGTEISQLQADYYLIPEGNYLIAVTVPARPS